MSERKEVSEDTGKSYGQEHSCFLYFSQYFKTVCAYRTVHDRVEASGYH